MTAGQAGAARGDHTQRIAGVGPQLRSRSHVHTETMPGRSCLEHGSHQRSPASRRCALDRRSAIIRSYPEDPELSYQLSALSRLALHWKRFPATAKQILKELTLLYLLTSSSVSLLSTRHYSTPKEPKPYCIF
jgi:hypothetical protein